MSHKKLTVNSVSPETLSLSDTITINSPVEGSILQKKATDWATTKPTTAADCKIGYLVTNSATGSYYYDAEDNYLWRERSGEIFHTENLTWVHAATPYAPASSTAWAMGFTLDGSFFNGKKVLIRAQPNPQYGANSSMTCQWGIGTGSFATWTPIGPKAKMGVVYGAPCWGLYTGTGTTETLTIKVLDITGSIQITGGVSCTIGYISMKVVE